MSNILIKHASSLFQVKSPPKFRGLENRTAFSRILKEKEKKLSTGESSKLAISLYSKVRLMKKLLKYCSILPMVGSIVISYQSLTRVDDLSEPIRKQGGDAIGIPNSHGQYVQMSLMSRGDCLTRTWDRVCGAVPNEPCRLDQIVIDLINTSEDEFPIPLCCMQLLISRYPRLVID